MCFPRVLLCPPSPFCACGAACEPTPLPFSLFAATLDSGEVPFLCDSAEDSVSVLSARVFEFICRLSGASDTCCRALNRAGVWRLRARGCVYERQAASGGGQQGPVSVCDSSCVLLCADATPTGLLLRVASAVGGDDILLLMNTVQYLPAMAGSAEGTHFLIDAGACVWALLCSSDRHHPRLCSVSPQVFWRGSCPLAAWVRLPSPPPLTPSWARRL